MKYLIFTLIIFSLLCFPVSAIEYSAPEAPDRAQAYMPENNEDFEQGLWHITKTALSKIQPELVNASGACVSIIAAVLLMSILETTTSLSKNIIKLTGTVIIATMLFSPINSLIQIGRDTIFELTDYGKLLIPIMTTALAAEGGITSSASIYSGTVLFNTLLSTVIAKIIIPVLYIYLCICVANSAIQQDMLNRVKSFIKWLMTWCLKIVLYVFTGYISISGIISGTVDASTLKASKIAISGVVPVVGNILSDATDSILLSAGVIKNSIGVYGIFAIIALCIGPFIQIGTRYLLLKLCSALCNLFGYKPVVSLIEDFSSGMGFILAMTGTVCVMLLISLVCFMKGVGI